MNIKLKKQKKAFQVGIFCIMFSGVFFASISLVSAVGAINGAGCDLNKDCASGYCDQNRSIIIMNDQNDSPYAGVCANKFVPPPCDPSSNDPANYGVNKTCGANQTCNSAKQCVATPVIINPPPSSITPNIPNAKDPSANPILNLPNTTAPIAPNSAWCNNDPNLVYSNGVCLPKNQGCTTGICASKSLSDLILIIVNYLLSFAGVIAVVTIIIGGFFYITSAGNEEQSEKGKSILINAIIGVVIVMFSYAIVKIVSNTLSTTNITAGNSTSQGN